ncbi:MAG: hypothetical protein Q4F79_12565 [Eubacteriales bacterium]|nr:hypothetical protein [Eubacteriales bacterium]
MATTYPKADQLNHTHNPYDNEVLAVEFEDQYESKLDLMNFVTVDSSLEMTPGMKKKIRTYTATGGTEVLAMGEGNSQNIEVDYEEQEYEVEMLQNRFPWYDEEAMIDPNIQLKGKDMAVTDIFNVANRKAMAEFKKAKIVLAVDDFGFDSFVDAVAAFPDNENDSLTVFALVNPTDKAEIRKLMRDDLKYIEAYVRTGYIGTINGVSLYTSQIAEKGTIILATKEAVRYFNKKGVDTEYERNANIRLNVQYMRKYGIFAFYDAKRAVKLKKGIAVDATEVSIVGTGTATVKASAVDVSKLTWKSDKTSVATVTATTDDATGMSIATITGVAAGTATVTATYTTTDGTKYVETIEVTVATA